MSRPPIGSARALTAGPLLRRNTLLNLLGQGLPLLVAIVAIPLLIEGIGVERFGLLGLAWLVIGYFSLFDLGIGRALTQLVSERIGEGRDDEIAAITWTGLTVMGAIGLVAWALLHWLAPVVVNRLLVVPPELRGEAVGALRILAVAVPFVTSAAGLRGLLEAVQRFGLISAVRIPMGALTFLGPLLVLPFSSDLRPVVGALAAARLVGWVGYLALAWHALPLLRRPTRPTPGRLRPLLRLGGWITVSNVVSPLMVHMDRVVIGAVLSMAAVAYYVTPFEVVTRLWIIPGAVVGVLFPAFATSFVEDPDRTAHLFGRATRVLLLTLLPVVILLVGFAGRGLEIWVGADFAREGTVVAQWLTVGVLVNCLAHVPYALLQAIGRPDLTAKLHVAEAPFYFFLLWGLLSTHGLVGAAIAWTIRVLVDTVLLFGLATRLLPSCRSGVAGLAGLMVPAVGMAAAAAIPVENALERTALLGVLLTLSVFMAWMQILDASQRKRVNAYFRGRRSVVLLLAAGPLLLTADPLLAQALPEERAVSSMGLGEDARYLRTLQLQGKVPLHPWGIRSFGPRERDLLVPAPDSMHPWRGRIGGRVVVDRDRVMIRVDPVEARAFYQSAYPLDWQVGSIWVGRGMSADLTAGGEVRAGPLTLRVAPTLWRTANRAFALMDHPRSANLPFSDPRHPLKIDFPQRFGDGSVGRLEGGASEIRLDLLGVTLGVSTAPIGWGPGEVFSLVMSGRGTGFSHALMGTSRPVDLRLFHLHVRGAWGELEQSEQAPWDGLAARRFASSLALSVSPVGVPGLEIGLGRFFHIPWREDGPRLDDVLRPMETILKRDRFVDDPEMAVPGSNIEARDNQLATGWIRWVFPHAGLEIYGEFARNDHPWDMRDLFVEPDQNAGWMMGAAWLRESQGRTWVFRGEAANARTTHLREIRNQEMFFGHSRVRQGHTHRGRILGTPAIYGGGGSYLGVDAYEEWGRLGGRWRRELRNDGFTPGGLADPSSAHDVTHALSLDGVWFRGRFEWSGEITGALNLNRHFQDDVFNLRLALGAKAHF